MTDPRPEARIKVTPDDFVVEEIPAYGPSGEGDHLLISFEKRGLDTREALQRIARALEVDPREAGYAGMKDRHAVTRQQISLPWPAERDPEQALGRLALDGIRIVDFGRHGNKLKTGHLRGNRFVITLRDVAPQAFEALESGLRQVAEQGVPNAYGRQRFGREQDNAQKAAAWIAGDAKPPRDRRKQRLLFSAWQSALFNQVLAAREADDSWHRLLPGDLAQKHDSGGVFLVAEQGPELDDAQRRGREGLLSPTGPMFGVKMRWPSGQAAEIEGKVLDQALPDRELLRRFKKLGRGARRPLRLWVAELTWDTDPGAGRAVVRFVLPKGGYATTVLARVVRLREERPERPEN